MLFKVMLYASPLSFIDGVIAIAGKERFCVEVDEFSVYV